MRVRWLMLFLSAAVGCAEPVPGAGRYTLTSVDGQPLPVSFGLGPRLDAATLTLANSHSFSESTTMTVNGSTSTETDAGAWRLVGASVELTYESGGTVMATLAGNGALTRDGQFGNYRYERR
jgi:hypothetical protein